jgi:hypothetical protein
MEPMGKSLGDRYQKQYLPAILKVISFQDLKTSDASQIVYDRLFKNMTDKLGEKGYSCSSVLGYLTELTRMTLFLVYKGKLSTEKQNHIDKYFATNIWHKIR